MFEVVDRLFIGDISDAQKPENISVIVNCTKDIPFFDVPMKYRLRVHVEDDIDPLERREMAMLVSSAVKFIDTVWKEGHRILIHCRMGSQRSACVTAAWLMHREPAFSANDAIRFLRKKSPMAFLMGVVHFRQVLDDFDKRRKSTDMPDVAKITWSPANGNVWQ